MLRATPPGVIMTATLSAARTSAHFRFLTMLGRAALLLACVTAVGSRPATAQDTQSTSAVRVLKRVALDPSTYAPVAIQHTTTMRDWNTSQVFFQHGFHERNERFTVSGLPNDMPVSYGEGRRRIFRDSLVTLGTTAAQNALSHATETYLAARFPNHKRVLTTLGWIQRASVASYMSYRLSIQHYRQTQYNVSQARVLGFE